MVCETCESVVCVVRAFATRVVQASEAVRTNEAVRIARRLCECAMVAAGRAKDSDASAGRWCVRGRDLECGV